MATRDHDQPQYAPSEIVEQEMKAIPTANPRSAPPSNEVTCSMESMTAIAMQVINVVKKVIMKGVGEGFISSAVLPSAASQALPNMGPYQK